MYIRKKSNKTFRTPDFYENGHQVRDDHTSNFAGRTFFYNTFFKHFILEDHVEHKLKDKMINNIFILTRVIGFQMNF